MPAVKLWTYKEDVEERRDTMERLALRDKVKSEKHLRYIRGITRRNRNDKVFARPNGLRENAETEKTGIPVAGRRRRRRRWMHRCARVAKP